MVAHLELLFPRLCSSAYQVTSPANDVYNCIAWAAGDSSRWWWPDPAQTRYWPAGTPRAESLAAFEATFANLGYARCDTADTEAGYEKIAFFADADALPTHAARQLLTGRWTSKLGELEDIEHTLQDLAGTQYGAVALVMKPPRK